MIPKENVRNTPRDADDRRAARPRLRRDLKVPKAALHDEERGEALHTLSTTTASPRQHE